MKYKVLPIALLGFFLQANAQNFRDVIRGDNGMSKKLVSLAADKQVSFNGQNPDAILDAGAGSKLVLKNKFTDNIGFTHYRYFQMYKGFEIQSSSFVLHTKDGKLVSMSGEAVVAFSNTNRYADKAVVPAQTAVANALNRINAKLYAWQDAGMEQSLKMQTGDKNATYKPKAQLVWFNAGDEINPEELRLCYRVNVYSRQPLSRADYFIDAQTGAYVGKIDRLCFTDATGTAATGWSGNQTIHSDFTGTQYRLRDMTKGSGVITLHGESGKRGTDYFSATANWSFSNTDKASLDAHYGVSQTWSFYMTNFGRNSYDGNGTALYSYVNDPTYIDNAFWDGSAMNFNKRSTGDLSGVTGIDVCGHELTHGVTQETSGLVYSGQSGGMNESLSDIMGKSVQFWSKPNDSSWLLSNDMNWIIRDISNPKAYSQPDTYQGQYWSPFADVHTLSGVGNFMFYLLDHGGSGTNDKGWNYNVTGIGLAKTDQIIYRSNLAYLSANAKYPDWRVACIAAATDLYGASSPEVVQVKNAWYAVGIDSVSGTTCAKPAGLTADSIRTHSALLKWGAVASATSYTLQWKKTALATWTTVTGLTTNSYFLGGLDANTSYDFRVQTVCADGSTSAASAAYTFKTTAIGGYCASNGTSTSYEFIQSVRVGSKKNNSGNDGGYGSYVSITAPLKAGKSYTLYLAAGFVSSTYTENFTVYIDYNRDKDFNDAGENIGSVSSSTTAEVPLQFTVPATAKNGVTLVRVQMQYGSTLTDPCAVFTYGEVEDYSADISGGSGIQNEIAVSADAISAAGKAQVAIVPNPVKGSSAVVNYTVEKAGNVVLKILDPNGQVVKTVQLSNISGGSHTYTLNGMSNVAAGNYFIVLKQDNAVVSRNRFVIMK